jgi:SpoVK/Ycf46/Vps4 family AAA+-type ATPase
VSTDPELLASLERALERDPAGTALRLHLALMYARCERWTESLSHAEAVLAQHPASPDALELAAQACAKLGQEDRGTGYRKLLEGLGSPAATGSSSSAGPGNSEREEPAEPVAIGETEVLGADLEAFLDEVLSRGSEFDRPSVMLADVGGLTDVKKRLQTSFLGPLRNPELRRMYGKSLRGGLLLYGPPGCGKTFLARAVAGELGARFFGIGLHDVLDMWLGKSEQNLHKIFETARRHAPCVLFFDEVDALGMKRSNLAHSAGRNVVVQLLSEMDNVGNQNDGVFVLAASNQPWDVDPALRRPGRLDRMLLVLPPDSAARIAILRYHLRDRPVEESLNVSSLAERTEGFSGADLRLVCESATETALEDSVRSGQARPITAMDLALAIQGLRPSTRAWFDMAKNYAMFANDDGAYDDLLTYMRSHELA